MFRTIRRLPFFKVVAIVQIALLVRRHLERPDAGRAPPGRRAHAPRAPAHAGRAPRAARPRAQARAACLRGRGGRTTCRRCPVPAACCAAGTSLADSDRPRRRGRGVEADGERVGAGLEPAARREPAREREDVGAGVAAAGPAVERPLGSAPGDREAHGGGPVEREADAQPARWWCAASRWTLSGASVRARRRGGGGGATAGGAGVGGRDRRRRASAWRSASGSASAWARAPAPSTVSMRGVRVQAPAGDARAGQGGLRVDGGQQRGAQSGGRRRPGWRRARGRRRRRHAARPSTCRSASA